MCVIYACKTALPSKEELARGAFGNSDGAGIAWLQEDQVFFEKGLTDDKSVLAFIEDHKIPLPLAIHFRTASIGGKSAELCHPFPVCEDAPLWVAGRAETVLFHNGSISSWDDHVLRAGLGCAEKIPEGDWSDSRALAWLTHLKGPGILPFIIERGRVLLFTADVDTTHKAYNKAEDHFLTWGSWIHNAGRWSQSISTFEPRGKVYIHNVMDAELEELPGRAAAAPASPAIWTVAELVDIINTLEKEQSDARIASGA